MSIVSASKLWYILWPIHYGGTQCLNGKTFILSIVILSSLCISLLGVKKSNLVILIKFHNFFFTTIISVVKRLL